jgi:serralysin
MFQQDLNGDGRIGLPQIAATPIETIGTTTLATAANHFYLLDGNGAGLSLKFSGADVVTGQFGGWTPIGAEKSASGYEIAWKVTGSDQYTIWNTDNNGNYIANLTGAVPGSDAALQSSETLFQQDLNGDGRIGLPQIAATPIETNGATALATATDHFYLLDGNGAGPSLKYGGADVVADQFGGWTPIGAEQTASGYEIAWKVTGADQYTVWNTDHNGTYIGNLIGAVPGSASALQSSETLFQQDLNGDGHIGLI